MASKITAYRLVKNRKRLGLSQVGAARLLGVEPTQLMEWEHGKRMPSPGNIFKLEVIYQRLIGDIYAELRQEAVTEIAENTRKYGPDGLGIPDDHPP